MRIGVGRILYSMGLLVDININPYRWVLIRNTHPLTNSKRCGNGKISQSNYLTTTELDIPTVGREGV